MSIDDLLCGRKKEFEDAKRKVLKRFSGKNVKRYNSLIKCKGCSGTNIACGDYYVKPKQY